ncbi:MAG: hypothetical protein R6U38_05760 [Desulfatiglandaceae bacterium]
MDVWVKPAGMKDKAGRAAEKRDALYRLQARMRRPSEKATSIFW